MKDIKKGRCLSALFVYLIAKYPRQKRFGGCAFCAHAGKGIACADEAISV